MKKQTKRLPSYFTCESPKKTNIFLTGNSQFTYYPVPTVNCGPAFGLKAFGGLAIPKPIPVPPFLKIRERKQTTNSYNDN